MANINFVSYDGHYPCLCSGTLTLNIDGTEVIISDGLRSGGHVTFDENWREVVSEGAWKIDKDYIPKEYQYLESEILEVINDNIPYGCCGGCV